MCTVCLSSQEGDTSLQNRDYKRKVDSCLEKRKRERLIVATYGKDTDLYLFVKITIDGMLLHCSRCVVACNLQIQLYKCNLIYQ